MTPLAHRIAKEIVLPKADRNVYVAGSGLPNWVSEAHCFDVTEVLPLIKEIAARFRSDGFDGRFAFLPAEKTWIEFKTHYGGENDYESSSVAWILEGLDGGEGMRVCCVSRSESKKYGQESFYFANKRQLQSEDEQAAEPYWVYLNQGSDFASEEEKRSAILEMAEHGFYSNLIDPFQVFAALALINTPRLIGRKQNMPHRGLEKALARAKGLVGKFPLRAWTELKLSVADIGRRADGTVHEAHYTGEKCLHFCRAHLRVRNGRLERVTAHWRGNPALGIKQTRYAITA